MAESWRAHVTVNARTVDELSDGINHAAMMVRISTPDDGAICRGSDNAFGAPFSVMVEAKTAQRRRRDTVALLLMLLGGAALVASWGAW